MNLNQVTVFSNDVAASIEFYKKLGLKLIVDSAPRYVRFECPDGDATFSVHHTEKPIESETVVYFECDDLEERVEQLKPLGNSAVMRASPAAAVATLTQSAVSTPRTGSGRVN
jgi:catechol 2,3-dioxygenase-like lactoylglutathione lyase family enzyme